MHFTLEPELCVEEFSAVLRASKLSERRPMDRPDLLSGMLRHSDVIVAARQDGRLVGVARALTDFHYCTYLADLAVDRAFQGRGIGRELVARTHAAAGLQTQLILLAAPAAETYYPHIGLSQHHSCWTLPRRE